MSYIVVDVIKKDVKFVQKKILFITHLNIVFMHLIQHSDPSFIPDVTPFTPMWGQEAPPQIVSYPELIAGFPCADLGKK